MRIEEYMKKNKTDVINKKKQAEELCERIGFYVIVMLLVGAIVLIATLILYMIVKWIIPLLGSIL